jgi:hypothetical protein
MNHPESPIGPSGEVIRGRAAKAGSLCRPVRWIPRRVGLGLQDLPGPLFDNDKCSVVASAVGRPCRSACLCGSHRDPTGRTDRRRASALVRPR